MARDRRCRYSAKDFPGHVLRSSSHRGQRNTGRCSPIRCHATPSADRPQRLAGRQPDELQSSTSPGPAKRSIPRVLLVADTPRRSWRWRPDTATWPGGRRQRADLSDGHISFRKAGMLSEDGPLQDVLQERGRLLRAARAGHPVLEKLSNAERDGTISRVIRGTGEKPGGRANSLTAPNPKSPGRPAKEVYTRAGVDPRTVAT